MPSVRPDADDAAALRRFVIDTLVGAAAVAPDQKTRVAAAEDLMVLLGTPPVGGGNRSSASSGVERPAAGARVGRPSVEEYIERFRRDNGRLTEDEKAIEVLASFGPEERPTSRPVEKEGST